MVFVSFDLADFVEESGEVQMRKKKEMVMFLDDIREFRLPNFDLVLKLVAFCFVICDIPACDEPLTITSIRGDESTFDLLKKKKFDGLDVVVESAKLICLLVLFTSEDERNLKCERFNAFKFFDFGRSTTLSNSNN